jgi:N utilization substance protein B
MAGGQRHRARVIALQSLYEADSSQHEPEQVLGRIASQHRLSREATAFAQALVARVLAEREELDRLIAKAAPAWPVEQLSPVDRNILRLAICEMLGDNGTPVRATINEAVELAKSFGSENSAKFINGVLGSIERQRTDILAGRPASKGGD